MIFGNQRMAWESLVTDEITYGDVVSSKIYLERKELERLKWILELYLWFVNQNTQLFQLWTKKKVQKHLAAKYREIFSTCPGLSSYVARTCKGYKPQGQSSSCCTSFRFSTEMAEDQLHLPLARISRSPININRFANKHVTIDHNWFITRIEITCYSGCPCALLWSSAAASGLVHTSLPLAFS